MKFGEIMYDISSNLTTLEKGLAVLSFLLLTSAVSMTIMDYKNKGKHINRKRW
jgi:predicted site-specific integrase-resolvase